MGTSLAIGVAIAAFVASVIYDTATADPITICCRYQ